MFKKLEGDAAIVVSGGVYKEAEIYQLNGDLFLKAAGGFVRMYKDGRTTKAKLNVHVLHTDAGLYADKWGRVTLRETDKPLSVEHSGADGRLQLEDKS